MSCRTNCCKAFLFVLLATVILAAPAFGQGNNCLGDVGPAKSCSANDVSIAAVLSNTVNVFKGGTPDTNKCFAGGQFSFTAKFEVKTTSNKTRSNIGIFFGTGQPSALHGTCTDNILSPLHPCASVNGSPTATCGSEEYEELDGSINGETTTPGVAGCGDTTSADSSPEFGAGTQAATLEVDNVTCPTSATFITLPVCTSWFQPTSTMPVCESPAPSYPWQPQAIAGTSSKCTCGTLNIPVQPISPQVSVGKTCSILTPTAISGVSVQNNLASCNAGIEGNTVTYTVTINNTTGVNEGGVIIDQICDTAYGTVFRSGTFGGPACAAGTNGTIASFGGCGTLDIPNGGNTTCTFTANHGENLTVTDTASVSGHSDISSTATFGPTNSGPVTVTSSDAPTTATTTKAVEANPISACVTARFDVTVNNTSGADESVTLNSSVGVPALNDPVHFGDITTTHGSAFVDGSVTGTTCGVATTASGLGTLSTSLGAGTFPQTLAPGTGSYSCKFDGVMCGNLAPIPAISCAAGLTEHDIVAANLTGDDSPPEAVSQTDNPLTADICLVASSH